MSIDVDVVIVGFGPGGEVLTSLLGQAGHRVAVFEKFPAPYGLPRMSTLDGEIGRLMQHTGDPARALQGALPQSHAIFYGADGKLAFQDDWSHQVCGHPSHYTLHQPNIEAAMEERVYACPSVQVHWGAEVVGIEDDGAKVSVSARTSNEAGRNIPEEFVVNASYVVGMDGASSFVRQALGIDLDVLCVHDDEWVLTDFEILDPDVDTPPTTVFLDPKGPFFWGPNGARRCRTDVRVMPGMAIDQMLTHEDALAFVERKLHVPRRALEVIRQVRYRFRSQIAKSFRKGRVFIGGDAAHAMTPGMGQGSCSAMRDGVNLAWKLDLVLSGRADAALLDTYEPERHAHVIPFVRGSLAAWQMTTEQDPVKAAQRDAYLRSGKAQRPPLPGLSTGVIHRNESGQPAEPAGRLGPQGRVRLDGREDLLDNLVGFGFQLISSLPLEDVLTPLRRARLQALNAKVRVIGDAPGQVKDLAGTYAGFLQSHGATAMIGRPDFYLFGVADGAEATAALIDELFEQLGWVDTHPHSAASPLAQALPASLHADL